MPADIVNWIDVTLSAGRYRVTRKLGEGGMGAVYEAMDESLDRIVVIKVPHQAMMVDPDFAARFKREIQALVRLEHPRVVKVLDVGEQSGLPFAVMQFLSGGSLAGQSKLKPLVTWMPAIADALDFIHSKGYVHRDVKPGNVLFDDHGNAYLADFGIIKVVTTGGLRRGTALTGAGKVVGTAEYMAPELILGHPYDGRADQYALGVMAYEWLAGQPPFTGPPTALMVKHTTESVRPLHEFMPTVPREISLAIQRALSKDPRQRFATCKEFAQTVAATPRAGECPLAADASPSAAPQVVDCPTCSKSFRVPPGALRKKLRCPICQTSFRVPKTLAPVALAAKTLPAASVAPAATAQALSAPTAHAGVDKPGTHSRRFNTLLLLFGSACIIGLGSCLGIWMVFRNRPNSEPPPIAIEDHPTKITPRSIPFGAVAPIERLKEIKTVRIIGQVRFASSEDVNDVATTWESMRRLKHEEKTENKSGATLLLIDNHGWMREGQKTITLQDDAFGFQQTLHYGTILSNLILLTEEGFDVEKDDAGEIQGKECFAMSVKRANRPTVRMFFEKDTNLLRKVDFTGRIPDAADSTYVEYYFSDYEVVDGIKHWKKQEQWRDGTLYSELNLTHVELFRTPDDTLFRTTGLDEEVERVLFDEKLANAKDLAKQGPKAIPALLKIIGSEQQPKIVCEALRSLETIGVKSEATLGALERHMNHPDAEAKNVAALALLNLGPERLQMKQLTGLMTGYKDEVRAAAEGCLRQRLSAVQQQDLPMLREGLKHSSKEVQLAFIDAIGSLKERGKGAAPDLAVLLGREDKDVSRQAIRALEKMDALTDIAVKNTDASIVNAAMGALKNKRVKSEPALSAYERHLTHPDAAIKNLAARALLELGTERLQLKQAMNLASWQDEEVRVASRRLLDSRLAAATRKDLPIIREGLRHANADIRIAFMDCVDSFKEECSEVVPDLTNLLAFRDREISERAASILHHMGELVGLAGTISDPDALSTAIRVLRRKGVKTKEALAAYEKNTQHANDQVKDLASLALIDFAPERLQKQLTQLLTRPNEELRISARRLLVQKTAVLSSEVGGIRVDLVSGTSGILTFTRSTIDGIKQLRTQQELLVIKLRITNMQDQREAKYRPWHRGPEQDKNSHAKDEYGYSLQPWIAGPGSWPPGGVRDIRQIEAGKSVIDYVAFAVPTSKTQEIDISLAGENLGVPGRWFRFKIGRGFFEKK